MLSVLTGVPAAPAGCGSSGRVVPKDSGAVFFAIYTHGDTHPATSRGAAEDKAYAALKARERPGQASVSRGADSLDVTQHEWFCHFPYPATRPSLASDMLEFVSTEHAGAAGFSPAATPCLLYGTQLRLAFAQMFRDSPARPVVGMLNYCRAGGALNFLRSDAARQALGTDRWPLFLAASAQAGHDAMVGGMWSAWFSLLAAEYRAHCRRTSSASTGPCDDATADTAPAPRTVADLFRDSRAQYFSDNVCVCACACVRWRLQQHR